jgi:hypothetical protein
MVKQALVVSLRSCSYALRACMRPFGHLAFVVAVWALSASAALLGREHELGGFAGRLRDAIRNHPEVTRRGVRMAWITWGVLLILACSPLDPFATWWDELALVAVGGGILWQRMLSGSHHLA